MVSTAAGAHAGGAAGGAVAHHVYIPTPQQQQPTIIMSPPTHYQMTPTPHPILTQQPQFHIVGSQPSLMTAAPLIKK